MTNGTFQGELVCDGVVSAWFYWLKGILTYHPSLGCTCQEAWRNLHLETTPFQFPAPYNILKLKRYSYSNTKQLCLSHYIKNYIENFLFLKEWGKACLSSKQELFFVEKSKNQKWFSSFVGITTGCYFSKIAKNDMLC